MSLKNAEYHKQNTKNRKKVEHLYLNRILILTKQKNKFLQGHIGAMSKKENYLSGLS